MKKDVVKKWVEKALHDFFAAEVLLEEKVANIVCFHCQQFVERILKAYLIEKGVDFGRTHNLSYLLELCTEIDAEFRKFEGGMKELN